MNAPFAVTQSSAPYIAPALSAAWEQSGVMDQKGERTWVCMTHDDGMPRAQLILLYANAAQGGGKKKFGPRPLLTHQIRGMDKIYNLPRLKDRGIDPSIAAFCYGAHDCVEDFRDAARKAGKPFSETDALRVAAEIEHIFCEPGKVGQLRRCLEYMTDAPEIHHARRIRAQVGKSFNAAGKCVVGPLSQLVRTIDKWEQVTADAWARKNGYLPDNMLGRQIERAEEKAYVLAFPIAGAFPELSQEYRIALSYLKNQHRQNAHPAPGEASPKLPLPVLAASVASSANHAR